MAALCEILAPHLARIRTPLNGEKIYKDECVFSFDTPESEGGLYVCLNTFLGFGRKHVERHYARTGNAVYLHLKTVKKELKNEKTDSAGKSAPTRLAIGLEGGFDVAEGKKYEYEYHNALTILPHFDVIPLPNPELPEKVQLSVATVLASDSANQLNEQQAMAGTWDGEKRAVSKHSETLQQLDNGVKVPPHGWRCEMCNLTENLWMNLTDGAIMCGRKFFDGSGGNNHALDHYKRSGFPLAVKLGTINPDGADVYSYDEDDMVLDSNLTKHLEHFGIQISKMHKTDKSMVELEIDMNQRIGEWAVIQESGHQLVPLYGPSYTGLANLGNSCYLNSVMQVVLAIPEFQNKYYEDANRTFDNSPPDPTQDFTVQMTKLAAGVLSGDYSKEPSHEGSGQVVSNKEQQGIKPLMFKTLVGKGHPEFSTKRQQDAQEYFLHFLNLVERNCRGQMNPAECFKFEVEERIQCMASGKVQYTKRTDCLLPLPIPLQTAINKTEVDAFEMQRAELQKKGERVDPGSVVRSQISLSACLEAFAGNELVDDFYSSAVNKKVTAQKTTRLQTFPDYLMIQLKKFAIGEDWVPRKLDVSVTMPLELDLNFLRGHGLQPGEEQLPESKSTHEGSTQTVELDESVVAHLCDMGFPVEACKKAVYFTENSGIEAATAWVMEHIEDPDFGDPFMPPNAAKSETSFKPDPAALSMVMSMGFSHDQAVKALKATDNNVERAIDWIFSRADELDSTPMEMGMDAATVGPNIKDGPGKYQLMGFISHMGTSTMVGHYVCHILKEGRWVIYNDDKVAISECPPKDLGYLYLYRRAASS
ncbi:ubiquitin carboxyl-terminal hydrolase 5 isoform X1 [Ixodes scapularis]|nr:ubiquitin carboxyl-terminal hydrolase 5 isoform X1 [Ixodes scapularis]